jgi:hypothetical protein
MRPSAVLSYQVSHLPLSFLLQQEYGRKEPFVVLEPGTHNVKYTVEVHLPDKTL